ncbi:MAG TPA: dihydropteroate synthase [Desulfatiglandales bacterium]|nr:dihydropteroate synthase [Desulfatiglandales bacterium]
MIIIGEKINATHARIKKIIQDRDANQILDLAKKQADKGADFIDVNVGTGVGSREEEIQAMQWAIETIQCEVEIPLCIDSADPDVMEAGLTVRNGKPAMINSTKADERSLERFIPLAHEYGSPLVALTMDGNGIPHTVQDRLYACEKVVAACDRYGISVENVYFDPLVMPISTGVHHGLVTLRTVTEIKKQFPSARTVLGISNISFGLPARSRLNVAFLHTAVYAGLDAALLDPLDGHLMAEVKTAEVLVGKDRHCRRYTRAFRE